ncbi:hypothetical protein LINPERPRIM_LOCUS7167, partial [Linum perenne]
SSSGSEERPVTPTPGSPTGETSGGNSSAASTTVKKTYTYELDFIDRSGFTKTVEIKYADFRRVASGGTRCVFNLDTLGVKP